MLRSPRLRTRSARAAALAVAVLVASASALLLLDGAEETPSVQTQEATVDVPRSPGSAERFQLDVTLHTPESTPAPAVLLPHGFGGSKASVAQEATEFAERGFVVLTYSARGFGASTGTISLNDPDREVADARYLIDYLEAQPSVATDPSGDPTLAVTGNSYAGALALLLAGTDDRVDAIAPVMTYNDLEQALLPNAGTEDPPEPDTPAARPFTEGGVFKQAWAGALFTGGMGASASEGPSTEAPEPGESRGSSGDEQQDPDGVDTQPGAGETDTEPDPARDDRTGDACGRFAEHICGAYIDLATTGTASDRTRDLLNRVSPSTVTDSITVPTLLVQGTQDTLFGLDQADANARQISEAGGEVTMIWYAGGHDGGSPGPQLREKITAWLNYQLRGDGEPLPGFSYDVHGTFDATRASSVRVVEAGDYPGLNEDTTARESLTISGPDQTIRHPPGGVPAAISGLPGLGTELSQSLSGLAGTDPPGQAAQFGSATVDDQLLVTGSSQVTLRVARAGVGTPSGEPEAEPVLFVKLYDVGPGGSRSLPGNAVAPVRVPDLPMDGTPVELTVTLPGIVHPVEPGHRLQLVVGTTDQAYADSVEPAAYQVGLADDGTLSVPSVPGETAHTSLPLGQLLGIGGVLVTVTAVVGFAALRRRGATRARSEHATTPLRIENLTKTYPGGLTAVSDLSFQVERGQVLGLLGPNGAGKTTALRMLLGLVTPTSGDIWVFGRRAAPGAPVLSRIGAFVEGPGFLPHLSGRKNLELYWASTGRPPARAHFTEALEIAGLGDALDRKVRTYSQGMRQRLAIAQAMLGLPELLVLDEPTNGLDPPQIHQMREMLRRYAETGRTVLVSSHLLSEVEQTSTHVVVMHHGTVVADGAVGEIVAAGGEASFVVDTHDAAVEAARTLGAVEGVSNVEVDGNTVHAELDRIPRSVAVASLVHAGISVEHVGPRRRLEDAFLQLVGEEGRRP